MTDVKPDRAGRSDFELLPAIDLRGGAVVRLAEGDFDRQTVYGQDPVGVARGFVADGARWIHVVDLDGARAGVPRQAAAVEGIVRAVAGSAAVEVGGGLRDVPGVERMLACGARRVVVGTAALTRDGFAGGLVRRYGSDRIAVALDVRAGRAVGEAWRIGAPGRPVAETAARLLDDGVVTLVVTAVERDGLLEGPDLDLLGRLTSLGGGRIVASGGLRSTDDVLAARRIGCAGAIVGRALYEGRLDLAGTIRALAAGPA